MDWIDTNERRPEDGQKIHYYFEPFDKFYVGTYEKETDTVGGNCGFTTMIPEVPKWKPFEE